MLILLSPAKRLKEENPVKLNPENQPIFFDQAIRVNKALKRLSPKKLIALQGISSDLADLNWQRNQDWNNEEEGGPHYYQAIRLFNGDAYLGLDADTLSNLDLEYAQRYLRILSGLYGWLKPLDLIEPYRLEMGTQIKIGRRENLYAFWRQEVTKQLKHEFKELPVINLASNEYSKVVDKKSTPNQWINVVFKDRNPGGQYRVMSFYAKKARGMMARFILQNRLKSPQELIKFDADGYNFSANDSSPSKLVFLRDHK